MKRYVAALLSGLFVAGCGPNQPASPPGVCAAPSRTALLSAKLEAWVPSASFAVPGKATVWAQVTKLPVTAEGPLGQSGPVADLHYIPTGSQPRLTISGAGDTTSTDPSFALSGSTGWQRMALPAGSWQVYSNTNPGIALVSCPA